MVWAGWGVSRVGGGDSCGARLGAGAFRTVPGGPGVPSRTGPSETIVSPGVIPQPQHSVPLPLRQQRRPNHGLSGQQQQQPQANSRFATTNIDSQRARTMRCVPLSRNGPNGPGDDSREWAKDMSRPKLRAGETRGTIMPQELEQAKWFAKRKRPTAGKPWAW
jgi:hypothetical protein